MIGKRKPPQNAAIFHLFRGCGKPLQSGNTGDLNRDHERRTEQRKDRGRDRDIRFTIPARLNEETHGRLPVNSSRARWLFRCNVPAAQGTANVSGMSDCSAVLSSAKKMKNTAACAAIYAII